MRRIIVRKLSDTTSLFYVIANVIVNKSDRNVNNFYKSGFLQKVNEDKWSMRLLNAGGLDRIFHDLFR